jgi:hypothetical protein
MNSMEANCVGLFLLNSQFAALHFPANYFRRIIQLAISLGVAHAAQAQTHCAMLGAFLSVVGNGLHYSRRQ